MARPQLRILTGAVVAALAVGGLAACDVGRSKTAQDDTGVREKVTAIRIDDSNGSVRVEGSAGVSAVSVHREVHYRGDKPGATSHVDKGVLWLSGCGRHCGADYVVTVPAGLAVAGGTSNGAITLKGVGTADVHTSNGKITVTGATGALKVRTSNGAVSVEGTRGGVDAQSSNGRITVTTPIPQDVRAHTSNASVTVTAAPAAYRISAKTSNGAKTVDLADDPSAAYRLDLSTSNGALTLRKAA
ncbi:DUF4097 family beta strand repeat-containing protein [Streptomyces sp. NRRL F-5123]|uniref:DUF4097 family beta strand repeat-containing protein n=1 Tax=Streptomyces sp. NRRL F-5123 TaxID=1463856 RepID=UPI0004E23EBC|nr:DUF4097 family beta strand repeat-containing protein [Streptomyces sp. NRRL F-5123]